MVAIFSALVNKDAFDDSAGKEARTKRALLKTAADNQATETKSDKSVYGLLWWQKKKNNNKILFILKIHRRLLVLDVSCLLKVILMAAGPQEIRNKEVIEEGSCTQLLFKFQTSDR